MDPTRHDADVRAIQEAIAQLVRGARKSLIATASAVAPELTPAAFVIMARITDSPRVSPAEVVAATGLDRSVVSRQLAVLAKGGYVVSAPDPNDGRVSLFLPTAAAAVRFGHVNEVRRAGVAESLEGWSHQDISSFAVMLKRFNSSGLA